MAVSGATTSGAVLACNCSPYQRSASAMPVPGMNFWSCGMLPCSSSTALSSAGVPGASSAVWRPPHRLAASASSRAAPPSVRGCRQRTCGASASSAASAALAKPTP